jgi:hypothetical protein
MSEENNENQEVVTPNENQVAAEKEARLLGWVPKEEFRDGDHWVDAEAFVKRGKEINPILRKNNETLLKKLDEANREIAEVKKVAKEFEKFQKENADRQVKQLSLELQTLKEQKKLAITQGDGEQVVAIDEAIDAVKEQQVAAKYVEPVKEDKKPEPSGALDPILVSWMGENDWFTKDTKFTRIADSIGAQINLEYPNLQGKAFLEKLDEELQEVLPDKYKKTTRRSPVEGANNSDTGRPNSGSGRHSYANLPPEAKAACDKYVKTIPGYTRESYLADYDWS